VGQIICSTYMLQLPFLLFTLIRSAQIAAYCLVAIFLSYVPLLILKKPLTHIQGFQSILVTAGVFLFQTSRYKDTIDTQSTSLLPIIFSFTGLIVESFGLIYRQNTLQKYSAGGIEMLFTTSALTLIPATAHSRNIFSFSPLYRRALDRII
jgi:hypothetical protein